MTIESSQSVLSIVYDNRIML